MNIIKTDDVMKKRILLVDDKEDMLMLCSRELIKAGYDITTACGIYPLTPLMKRHKICLLRAKNRFGKIRKLTT